MERQSPESSVSFHLSARVPPPPPLHRGAPGTRIYSAEHASLFSSLHVLPVPPPRACFGKREAFTSVSAGITRRLDPNGSRPSRGAQLWISSSGTSAALLSVQEWQRPPMSSQQRHHMCRQLQHQAGNAGICYQPSSPSPSPALSLSSLPY